MIAIRACNILNSACARTTLADETTDVGTDGGTPVSDDYGPKDSRYTGRIRWVQLDIDEAAEDLDHLITPEERLRIAMARQ